MKTISTSSNSNNAKQQQLIQVFGEQFIAERDAAEIVKAEKVSKKKAATAKRLQTTGKSNTDAQVTKINKASAKTSWTDSVVRKANELCVAREKFETETLARSNKELYGILSSVYGLFNDAVRENCLKDVVVKMKAVLTERNVRVQKNTNALTVFVRYVFNSDRKRAYNYASTLMAAVQAEITVDKLAAFIESKNGVEECKKEFRKKTETIEKEIALADAKTQVLETLRDMKAQRVVKLEGAEAELAEGTDFVFVVARKNKNGSLDLLQTVSKTTLAMQNYAVNELAKFTLANGELGIGTEVKDDVSNSAIKFTKSATAAKSAAKMTLAELECA